MHLDRELETMLYSSMDYRSSSFDLQFDWGYQKHCDIAKTNVFIFKIKIKLKKSHRMQ